MLEHALHSPVPAPTKVSAVFYVGCDLRASVLPPRGARRREAGQRPFFPSCAAAMLVQRALDTFIVEKRFTVARSIYLGSYQPFDAALYCPRHASTSSAPQTTITRKESEIARNVYRNLR